MRKKLPSSSQLAGGSSVAKNCEKLGKTAFSAFDRNRDLYVLRELKLQTAFFRKSYVLLLLGLGRIGVAGIALSRSFAGPTNRVAYQLVGFSVHVNRSKSHGQFRGTLLGSYDATGYLGTLGNHGLSVHLDRRGKGGSKGIFFFQAEDGIRDKLVTGVQTCALPICMISAASASPLHTASGRSRRTS